MTGSKIFVKDTSSTVEKWIGARGRPDGTIIVESESAIDQGIATGGTNTTLVDTTKDWGVNMWADAIVEVLIGGISYHRAIVSNTATTLTINALAALVTVAAGCPYSIKQTASSLAPLTKATVHNAAYVAAADILAADITPTNIPSLFSITAAFTTAGVLSVDVTRGGNTQTMTFNHGVVLVADSIFMFDILVQSGDAINFHYSNNSNISLFKVVEIPSAI